MSRVAGWRNPIECLDSPEAIRVGTDRSWPVKGRAWPRANESQPQYDDELTEVEREGDLTDRVDVLGKSDAHHGGNNIGDPREDEQRTQELRQEARLDGQNRERKQPQPPDRSQYL